MIEAPVLSPIDFFTPVVDHAQDFSSSWRRLASLANDYLRPLSLRSGYRGFQAAVLSPATSRCRLEPSQGSYLVTAIKIASYRWWMLPLAALLIKGADRLINGYTYEVDAVLTEAIADEDCALALSVLRQTRAGQALQQDALSLFARRGELEGMRLLVQRGVDGGLPDRQGRAAIHYAAQAGHVEAVKLLLRHGVPLGTRTEKELDSPLHCAIKAGAWNVVKLLQEEGADLGQLNGGLKSCQDLLEAAER